MHMLWERLLVVSYGLRSAGEEEWETSDFETYIGRKKGINFEGGTGT
jgi:hypothetical protein